MRDPDMFQDPGLIARFIAACRDAGHEVLVTSTARTWQEQAALFAQGREPLAVVNRLRKLAGLRLITQRDNRKCVTWTLNSKHVVNRDDERLDNDTARAFDFVVLDKSGAASWDVKADIDQDRIPDYDECAQIGESLGLISGRTFKNQDYCHLEIG